jgi:hypothetical protein
VKNKLAWCLLAGSSLLFSMGVTAQQPTVLVEVDGEFQGYFEQPRLATVLAPLAMDANKYWPGARLYRLQPEEIAKAEQLRVDIAEQLRVLAIYWKDEAQVAAALMELRAQLNRWRLAKPVNVLLDPDAVRINPALNPKLDMGNYLLQVKARPNFLTFVSLGGDQFIKHQADLPVYSYLAQLTQNRWTDSDTVYWIVNGQPPVVVPVASWNRNQQAVTPGSLVFVPIPSWVLTEATQKLNQQLLQLLQFRVTK